MTEERKGCDYCDPTADSPDPVVVRLEREVESLTARLAAAEAENENLRLQCAAFDYSLTNVESSLDSMRAKLAAAEARNEQDAKLLAEHPATIKRYREKYEQEKKDRQKAEARQYSVGAEHLREYAARVQERDEAREAAHILCDDLSQFTRVEWLMERWPWLKDAAKAAGGCDATNK